jgi:hypothetical protein
MDELRIAVNGIEYVRKDSIREPAQTCNGMDYVIVRTYSAGAFAGYMAQRDGKEVTLCFARRLWKWEGAASLSQLAQEGTSKPNSCKFPCAVDKEVLTEAIEILSCTEKARVSIEGVKIWQA